MTQQQPFRFAPVWTGPWPAFIYHDEVAIYGLPAGRDCQVPSAVKLGEHGMGPLRTRASPSRPIWLRTSAGRRTPVAGAGPAAKEGGIP